LDWDVNHSGASRLPDRKYAALAAQASQTEAVRGIVGEERYREVIRVERFVSFARPTAPA
jgi:hypothetical protein